LTGEKVWILNASKGSTNLQTWKEGGFNYRHAVELFTTAEEILYNEVLAGHYKVNKMGIVNYTTANGDETWSAEEYTTAFNSMWEGFRREMALYDFDGDGQNDTVNCIGLLPLWNPCAMNDWNNLFPEPLAFYNATGDMYYGKLINYSMSAYENDGVIMASVAGRSWTSDANVAAYFAANPIASMYGKLQNGTTHTNPTTMRNGVYGDGVHYCQLGYNVQGIETAENMYEYWYGGNNVASVTLLQANGVDEVPNAVVIPEAGTYVVVPVANPSSAKLAFTVTGDAVSYSGCLLTAKKAGTATLTITDIQGNVLKIVNITVGEDPGEEPVIRDISTSKLTEAEKAALAALAPTDWDNYSTNLNGAGVWMYKAVNIDVSAYFNKTIHSILQAEFDASGGNGYVRKEQTNDYQTMLLDNSWGGRDFADQNDLAEMNLEIGDVFCGRFKISGSNVYWTALYQGNGNFLVVQNGYGDPLCFVATVAEVKANAWHYYYVLRPDNLAP
jgi:hypothetical protein